MSDTDDERSPLDRLIDAACEVRDAGIYLRSLGTSDAGKLAWPVRRAVLRMDDAEAEMRSTLDEFGWNASTRFEVLAAAFYRATRMLAPGKDDVCGSHSYEDRIAAWDAWRSTGV